MNVSGNNLIDFCSTWMKPSETKIRKGENREKSEGKGKRKMRKDQKEREWEH